MNTSMRDAVVAVRDFAEAMRLQYTQNLALLAGDPIPVEQLATFPTERLTAAQSFVEANVGAFIVLGHVENTQVRFSEMEALCWLANDASAFDNGARRKEIAANPGLKNVVVLFGERTVARASYVKALLGGFVRALDEDLFERAKQNEQGLPGVAQALSQESMRVFAADLEAALPTMMFKREIADYARRCGFPALPVALAHKLRNHQVINGVVLSPNLAEQLRTHLAPKQTSAA